MNVNPAQTSPHQMVGLQKREHFVVTGYRRMRQCGESTQHLVSLRKVAARQLSGNEVMRPDLRLFQQLHQLGVASPQMIYPDRCIDQHPASVRCVSAGEESV